MTDESRELQIDEVASLVDAAAESAEHDHDVGTSLRRSMAEALSAEQASNKAGPAHWTIYAFEFHPDGPPAGRDYFKPWMIFADGTANMPFLADLPDECLSWWSQLAEKVVEPRARARLEHLLFLRKYGNGGARARRAAESYLSMVSHTKDIYAVDAAGVALELARRVRQSDIAKTAIDVMAKLATDSLTEEHPLPGVTLRLIRALLDEADPGVDVDQLLVHARTKYAGQVHNEDAVIQFQLQRAKGQPDLRARLWAERVAIWIAAADAAEPVVRTVHLQRAIEHARSSEDRELVEEATAKLQSVRLDDLGLTSFSVEMARPRGRLEQILRPILNAGSWQEALTRFAQLGPITGNLEDNRRLTEDLARQFPLGQLFPPVQLGGDGLPRFSPTNDDDIREYHLVSHEVRSLQLNASIVLEALVRIIDRFDMPPFSDLVAYFSSNAIIPDELAAAIARAFLRFWAGDAEGAAFTITPRIEALARNLLLASNAGIYRIQRQQVPGQYPGLRFMLDELLNRGMDPSWYRFLFVLCAHVVGLNYRNELSHGFVDNASDGTAAVLLQAAAYLALLTPTPKTSAAPGDDG